MAYSAIRNAGIIFSIRNIWSHTSKNDMNIRLSDVKSPTEAPKQMGHTNKLLLCHALQTMLRSNLQTINNAEEPLE